MDTKNQDKYRGMMLDGRYELVELIGSGGMAVVYKAMCHRLNRYVAVKIMRPELASRKWLWSRNSWKKKRQSWKNGKLR